MTCGRFNFGLIRQKNSLDMTVKHSEISFDVYADIVARQTVTKLSKAFMCDVCIL